MMQSLVNDAEQSGWYPRWPAANDVTYVMGGDSPVILLASSYAFGARNFDVETALQYMVKAGTQPGVGPMTDAERPFLADYLKLGYVPDRQGSHRRLAHPRIRQRRLRHRPIRPQPRHTSRIQDLPQAVGKLEEPLRSRNPLDSSPATPTAHGCGFDAEHSLPKRPNAPVSTDQNGFEEGNTYQYSFMIPFDYPALFSAWVASARSTPRLDKFFLKLICWGEPCFNMENEPDFVTPYAYVFAGKPWKTQDVVTRIEQQTFNTTPDGIPGNDDLGATSGVYVWNALGFYPAVPGVGGVVLGTPMFPSAAIHLGDGRTLYSLQRHRSICKQGAIQWTGEQDFLAAHVSAWPRRVDT